MKFDTESSATMYQKWGWKTLKAAMVDHVAFDYFGDVEGKSVVDFGCGTGAFLNLCVDKNISFGLGIDINEAMITSGGHKALDQAEYDLARYARDLFRFFQITKLQFFKYL